MKVPLRAYGRYTFLGVGAVTMVAFWGLAVYILTTPDIYEDDIQGDVCASGNVAIIKMYGLLDFIEDPENLTISVDPIVEQIDNLGKEENIEAIVLDTYSGGGLASAGEAVANALKRSPKKTVALVKEEASSAAYLAITGADRIYANRMASVGSLGVTMSYMDETEKNLQEGVRFIELASAPYKDSFNMDKPITADDREMLTKMIKSMHATFVAMVAENRQMNLETAAELADGSTYRGEEATRDGLIDAVGDLHTIVEDLVKDGIDVQVCP